MRSPALPFFRALGLLIAAVAALAGAVLGWSEHVAAQLIIFYAAATFALVIFGWQRLTESWLNSDDLTVAPNGFPTADAIAQRERHSLGAFSYFGELISANRIGFLLLLLIAAVFAILSFVIDGFFSAGAVLIVILLIAYAIAAYRISRAVGQNRSAFIGLIPDP